MLSPVSLRICCLAVMAPALRKAVCQAENFNLPHSPASSTVSNSSSPPRITEDTDYLLDCVHNGNPGIYHATNVFKKENCLKTAGSGLQCLPQKTKSTAWIDDKHIVPFVGNLKEHINGNLEKEHWNHNARICGEIGTSDIKHKSGFPLTTMNKNIPGTQDRMGLLNANTSLESDFKNKFALGRQNVFSSEQQLLMMSPKELDISQLPSFTEIKETMEHPLTPPASRPGSEPAVGASSMVISSVELKEAQSRFIMLEKRAEFLMSRLRKLQGRQIDWHVGGQLKAFVDYQQKSLGITCQRQLKQVSLRKIKDPADIKAELLQSEDVRNLSTAALVNLVRKLESTHTSGKVLQSQKGSALASSSETNQVHEKDKVLVKLNTEECKEMKRASGTLLANITHLESAMDSDATESSSGGESCDESERFEEQRNNQMPIHRRAAWKWALDRVAVASRWTWLQAQVSDLEYRIRQQNDLYRQLRASKGPVILEDIICSTENETDLSGAKEVKMPHSLERLSEPSSFLAGLETLNFQSTTGSSLIHKHQPKIVNGYLERGSVTSNGYHAVRNVASNSNQCSDYSIKQPGIHIATDSSGTSGTICNVSRTRPVKNFRKRKLLRTMGLHLVNRKAARLSTVRCNCSCQCEMLPCVLCGGRYNNIQSIDTEVMPLLERIAILDPCLHPVLSFEHDISLGFYYESLLKNNESQHCVAKLGTSIRKKSRLSSKTKGFDDHARKHCRKLAKNAAQTLLSSARFRRKYTGNKRTKTRDFEDSSDDHRKKRSSSLEIISGHHPDSKADIINIVKDYNKFPKENSSSFEDAFKRYYERHRTLSAASSESSKPGSPVPSPSSVIDNGGSSMSLSSFSGTHVTGKAGIFHDMKKKRESAYDINNIVIPYSIASATRVEKLQYKEIITPKWRVLDIDSLNSSQLKADEEETEDVSEETVIKRHLKCEEDEKKRFLNFLHLPSHGRARFRSRFDGRADSSGANTPDPLSPHQVDILGQDSNSVPIGGPYSPTVSPPATPIPLSFLSDDSLSLAYSTPVSRMERKRTASISKRDRPGEELKPIDFEEEYVAPYDPRTFPLPDEDYEEMLKNSHHFGQTEYSEISDNLGTKVPSSPYSPATSSSSTSSALEEDPTDPEWTVITHDKGTPQSLVLKLAKR